MQLFDSRTLQCSAPGILAGPAAAAAAELLHVEVRAGVVGDQRSPYNSVLNLRFKGQRGLLVPGLCHGQVYVTMSPKVLASPATLLQRRQGFAGM